jgi:hypothetical protein
MRIDCFFQQNVGFQIKVEVSVKSKPSYSRNFKIFENFWKLNKEKLKKNTFISFILFSWYQKNQGLDQKMLVMLLLRFSSLLMIRPFFLPLNKNCYQVENMFQVIKIRDMRKTSWQSDCCRFFVSNVFITFVSHNKLDKNFLLSPLY